MRGTVDDIYSEATVMQNDVTMLSEKQPYIALYGSGEK